MSSGFTDLCFTQDRQSLQSARLHARAPRPARPLPPHSLVALRRLAAIRPRGRHHQLLPPELDSQRPPGPLRGQHERAADLREPGLSWRVPPRRRVQIGHARRHLPELGRRVRDERCSPPQLPRSAQDTGRGQPGRPLAVLWAERGLQGNAVLCGRC